MMKNFIIIARDAYLSALAGDLESASIGIERVRSGCCIENSAQIAVEVMLVEGVTHIYSGRPRAGVERLTRAVAICDSAGIFSIAALARGWLAMVHYNDGDVVAAGRVLSEALRSAEYADARTCLRVSTIAGGLCEYSGLGKSAANWLAAAQVAARRMAIPGVLSSVVYDLAITALDSAAARKLTGTLSPSDAQILLLRVRSALNYDSTADVGVHRDLHWLVLAMVHNICAEYVEAERCLEEYFNGSPSFRDADRVCARIELAIAKSRGGELRFESDVIEYIQNGLDLLVEPIERAMAFDVLAQNYLQQGQGKESESMRREFVLEVNRRANLSNSLNRVICEGSLLEPPRCWTN